jgi:hypothetical protein
MLGRGSLHDLSRDVSNAGDGQRRQAVAGRIEFRSLIVSQGKCCQIFATGKM